MKPAAEATLRRLVATAADPSSTGPFPSSDPGVYSGLSYDEAVRRWVAAEEQTAHGLTAALEPFLTEAERRLFADLTFVTLPILDLNGTSFRDRSGARFIAISVGLRLYLREFLVALFEAYGCRDRKDQRSTILLMAWCWSLAERALGIADGPGVGLHTHLLSEGLSPPTPTPNRNAVIDTAESAALTYIVAHELAHHVLWHVGEATLLTAPGAALPSQTDDHEFAADALALQILLRSPTLSTSASISLGNLFAVLQLLDQTRTFAHKAGLREGGGIATVTHPTAAERFRRLATSLDEPEWFDSTWALFHYGIEDLQRQVLEQMSYGRPLTTGGAA